MRGRAALITAFDPLTFRGGIETFSLQVADLLRRHSIDCDIISPPEGDSGDDVLHNRYLARLYQMGRKMCGNDMDYDFIIANSFYGLGYFPPRVRTFNIFHLTHKGFAEEIKDVVPRSQYLEWKLLWGDLAECASGLGRTKIAVSGSVRDELKLHYGFYDVEVLPNGIDTDTFVRLEVASSRMKWGIPEGRTVGLYVGRWDILKGCDILQGAISRTPDVHWVVVLGTGSDRNAVPRLDNLQVIEQVAHDEMRELYSAADFMLFPSRYEGFGYVIAEAMACGLPVITTNVGIAKTICETEPFNRLRLPALSLGSDALAAAAVDRIAMLEADAGLRKRIAADSRRIAERDLAIERWEKGIVKMLGVS